MKTKNLMSSLLLAGTALIGCAADGIPPVDTHSGVISTQSSVDFSSAPLCDLDTPCSTGFECMYISALDLGSAICVDPNTVCDALDCGGGECLVLESYPAQLMCSGGDGSGDDDDGDDNCSVSSDGTVDCPDPGTSGSGDSGSGSSPGNPGP